MLQGRGKKGNRAPRKRSRKTVKTMVEMEATATIGESMADIIPECARSALISASVYPQVASTSMTPNEIRQHSMPAQQV